MKKELGEKLFQNRSDEENKKNVRKDKTTNLQSAQRLLLTLSRVSNKVSMTPEKAEAPGEVR